MTLIFKPDDHSYKCDTGINWTSVTSVVSSYVQPFDSKAQAIKSSRNKRSKWYKMPVEEILQAWEDELNRSLMLGNFYHNQRERDMLSFSTMTKYGKELKIIKPVINEEGYKVAPNQKLEDGIYPEHFVYLDSLGWCGQADLVEVHDGLLDIGDYKTSKEIKRKGYTNWEGISKKMLKPLHHLDDCEFNKYALQLSIYAFIILRHNPNLKLNKLVIQHVKFEEAEEKNKYGYPIHLLKDGKPIIKEIEYIELPYLRKEIQSIINEKLW